LAPHTPPVYSAPVDTVARAKLDEAFSRVRSYYQAHGEAGLEQRIREELARSEEYVRRMARRSQVLASGAPSPE
jgi:hypothetical protein